MNTSALQRSSISSALLLVLGATCIAASCDSGGVDPTAYGGDAPLHVAPPATVARAADRPPPAYFGEEYAEVQKALHDKPDEPMAPTF